MVQGFLHYLNCSPYLPALSVNKQNEGKTTDAKKQRRLALFVA
jgi:hypothetical protein